MTPSMGMAAPKGMAQAAPQAGLAALAQPNTAAKGMSSGSMAQIMATARKMSDSQLAQVLQGKSLDVPQYVAMTEAMGRKQLRTAVDGQQAMAQAKQPSLKEKLLMGDQPQMPQMPQGMPPQGMPQQPMMAAEGGLMYDGGGIADLPAPNMESVDMASGGIVAFADGGDVPRYYDGGPLTEEEMQQLLTRGSLRRSEEDTKKGLAEQPYFGSQRNRPYKDAAANAMKEAIAAAPTTTTAQAMQQDMENAAPGKVAAAPAGGPTVDQINALNARPRAPNAPNEKAGLGGTDEFASYMDMVKKNNGDFLSKLEGLSAKQREGLAQLKSQGGGEALLNLAGALFSNPNMAMALGQGAPAVAKTAAASRKEQKAIEQSANEYDLNLAKAQEAAAKGDVDAAMQFKKLAQDAKYQQGMLQYHNASLNKPGESMQLLQALGDPEMMKRFQAMNAAKKPTDVIPKSTALQQYNDRLEKDIGKKFEKKFPTFESYYNDLTSGTSGGGNPYQNEAAAILASRSSKQ